MSGSARSGSIEPGLIIRRTFEVLNADLPAYVLLALVLVGAPSLLSSSLLDAASLPVVIIGEFVLATLLSTIVIHSALGRLGGEALSIVASLAPGLRFWLLACAVEIIVEVAVLFGLALLIVPGVILSLRWMVPVPILMAEGLGIGAALRRSTDLTRGHRKPLLGLALLWLVPFFIVPTLMVRSLQDSDSPAWVAAAIGMVADMSGSLTSAAGLAVIYSELRRIKEGSSRVVDIFN